MNLTKEAINLLGVLNDQRRDHHRLRSLQKHEGGEDHQGVIGGQQYPSIHPSITQLNSQYLPNNIYRIYFTGISDPGELPFDPSVITIRSCELFSFDNI